MRYILTREVAQMFPTFVRGVVVALGINNTGRDQRLASLLREAEEAVRQDNSLSEVTAHPRIANWRAAFTAFGVKPSKFNPSIEALVRRVRKGDAIPYINDMVAFCNYISLKHLVPIGGHALDDCDGNLFIRRATGKEPFTPIGSTEVEYPDVGEVILSDESRALTRRWIWRQAEATKVTEQTTKIEINIDALQPVTRAEVEEIAKEVTELVNEYFRPRHISRYILDAYNREIEFEA